MSTMFSENEIVLFDTEYTSWEGCVDTGWDESEGQYKELVQIGAVKIDVNDMEVIDTFNQLVEPRINTELSEYFIELTQITQEEINERGRQFEAVLTDFIAWVDATTCYSYGSDKKILEYNLNLYDLEHTKISTSLEEIVFNDVRETLELYGVPTDEYVSGTVSQYFNRTPDSEYDTHNALYDCLSIFEAIKSIMERG